MTGAEASILLVEDNPTDVLLIRRAFEQAKVVNPLQVLSDGDSAVAYLAGEGAYSDRSRYPVPVLILLDLKLPRRSGIEVLEWLRAQPALRRIPVVMLTSSRQARDVDAAYDRGVNSYLVKPVDFDGLFGMLKSVNLYWLIVNEPPRLSDAGPPR